MEIRGLGQEHREAVRDLLDRAFGRRSDAYWERAFERARSTLGAGRQFGAFEGDRLVATAVIHDMAQWWHGRPVSMGGVSEVAVAPEMRGRGIGRALMTGVLESCAALGHAVSMLYPATTPLYRSFGWEHAGGLHGVRFAAEALRSVRAEPLEVRRATPDDAAEVARVIGQVHRDARASGPVDWGEDRWRVLLADPEKYFYLAEDGFLEYRWSEGNECLEVGRLVAGSERTLRALWALVGSGSSTASSVTAYVAPQDPVFWLTRERSSEEVQRTRWMLRVVDAPAAIQARGYPAGVAAEVPLIIDDPWSPANAGAWRLEVKDGSGRLERSAETPGAVRVGAGGLAALYSGVPTATLRAAGLLEGDAPELDAVFAALPFSLDHF
ncbi:enhanced intracellular survival protein Eis [Actinomadura sp. 9N407]|uniref:enhanced intracellular survival protein Eis n=1 Tax=Actinomadura sp. 9N407 TaxID=3375154 RepID=UPI00378E1C35